MSNRIYFLLFLGVTLICSSVFAGTLKFNAEIPKVPEELPVLRLTAQPAPIDLINRLLTSSNPNAQKIGPLDKSPFFQKNRIKIPEQVLGVAEDEHMKAWVDRRSGDAAIYPDLTNLKQISPREINNLSAHTKEVFESPEFIAHDDTRFVVDKPQILNGTTLTRDNKGQTQVEKAKAQYLLYIPARRYVGDYPVDGNGSRALLIVGASGSIEGLTRSWKSAKIVEKVRGVHSADQIQKEITNQLQSALTNSDVIVDHVSLAYFDSNRDYLQPVYRFTAQIHHIQKVKPRTADDYVIGYVPFAKTFEPTPSMMKKEGPSPTPATERGYSPETQSQKSQGDPIVGRYVVREDDQGWVDDANNFWSSLSSTWTGFLYTNSQYYWAEPRLFTNQKNSFINAMNLALIEVHGDWWLYSTLKNCCDLVDINTDIPNPGYGPSANGVLADWIIHSCEVVPAPDDTAQWPDPWWDIFGGVRNVVGYRTIMFISDGAGGPYGTSLGYLAPVVSSWLSDVISLNAYSGNPSANAHGEISRPMGRPSTISMCGHDNDSALSTSTLGRANCLTVWWFPD